MGIAVWRNTLHTRYPDLEAANQVVESLIHPTADDLRSSLKEVHQIRPEDIDQDPRTGEYNEVIARLRDGEYNRVYYSRNREEEVDVPNRLREIAWQFWSESAVPRDRARAALVLAAYEEESASEFLILKAALRHATNDVALPKEEWLPVLSRLAHLAYTQQESLLAYALWFKEESELGFHAASNNFGPALYNQGVALQTAGFPDAAELVFLRLIASKVNDQDAGPDIMTAARNYRHWAAHSIAGSRAERGMYLSAMAWQYRAMNEFEFKSWCGTCNSGVADLADKALLKDSLFAGPLFFCAVLAIDPIEYRLDWTAPLSAALFFLWRRWRRRRVQAAAEAANVNLP